MSGPAQTSEPVVQYLYQLIDAIAEGVLLIPRFQRPLVWEWDRQAELLRSVRDGIPMGAVMVWRTSGARISWQPRLAGHVIPEPRSEAPHQYLLDGLQRLSTLFEALKAPADGSRADVKSIGYDLNDDDFVIDADPKPHIVPLRVLSDSVVLLRFQRSLTGPNADRWIARSDELAKSFREYKVPVIPIVSDDFEVAARTFNLINSQGMKMGEADMIHALTWSPRFELRDRIEALRNEVLQPLGWGELESETILKVVKAEADLDLYEESVEEVSEVLKRDPEALERAFENVASVAALLAEIGVLSSELVPYELQIVLLAEALRLGGRRAAKTVWTDWFWLTTYGEVFAGLSGYRLGKAVNAIRETAQDGLLAWPGANPFRLRPMPATTDFRSARTKAIVIQLARTQAQYEPSAQPYRTLADHGRLAISTIVPKKRLTEDLYYSSPGNRFLCAPANVQVLKAKILSGAIDNKLQSAHVISDEALDHAVAGRWDSFVASRFEQLAIVERSFVVDILDRNVAIPHETSM